MSIAIDKTKIESLGKHIVDLSDQLDLEIKAYAQVIAKVSTVWQDQAALTYCQLVEQKNLISLSELKTILFCFGEYLKLVPGAYELLDETFVSRLEQE